MVRTVLAALFLSSAPAAAAPITCAAVLARADSEWLLAQMSSRLNVVHAYGGSDGAVVLVHEPQTPDQSLHLYEYRFDVRDRADAVVQEVPWPELGPSPEMFRPVAIAPGGHTRARIPLGARFRVTLEHENGDATQPDSLFFLLDPRDRRVPQVPAQADRAWSLRLPLDLSFSPDGTKLLGYNAMGVQVFDVASGRSTARVSAEKFAKSQFSAWLDDNQFIEVSKEEQLRRFDVDGALLDRRTVPGRRLDVTVTWLDGTPHLVTHEKFHPLLFVARNPRTLERTHLFRVSELPADAQLDWIQLTPAGFAVFQLVSAGTKRLAVANFAAAFRHRVESSPWQERRRRD